MSELTVNWLEKKYAKSKEKFYNSKGACCLNTQVKNFVKERGLDDSATDTAGYGASDKLTTGMSIIHVYFKELEVVLYTKQENFGIIDLIGKKRFGCDGIKLVINCWYYVIHNISKN